jgi:hypothetical protein
MKEGAIEYIPSIIANGEFELSTDVISKRRISFLYITYYGTRKNNVTE